MKNFQLTSIQTYTLLTETIKNRDKTVMEVFNHVFSVLNRHFKNEFLLIRFYLWYEFEALDREQSLAKLKQYDEVKSLDMQGEIDIDEMHWNNTYAIRDY
ncbi:hypothetical protein DZB84_16985 [Bacillus sp. HNG]|uniref:hypothetical protein n=1 Tax=Bacillus sp. HNG TaxID=2293325 RepID=UPI000E2F97ED|nr:hypothetical protein [Bacillus sp. HNG]RFB13654.1 hypothetical protein DZB84_16985 [Bacillus sp. HNG]